MPETETRHYQCRHIFTDGHRCGSPALRNEPFCYYHHTSRRPAPSTRQHRYIDAAEPFTLPIVEDRASALLVASLLLSRIASNDLDTDRAGRLISGLRATIACLPRQPRSAPSAQPRPAPTPQTNLIDDPIDDLIDDLILDEAHGPLAPIAELPIPAPPAQPAPAAQDEPAHHAPDRFGLAPSL
jgi:hypothetical protein